MRKGLAVAALLLCAALPAYAQENFHIIAYTAPTLKYPAAVCSGATQPLAEQLLIMTFSVSRGGTVYWADSVLTRPGLTGLVAMRAQVQMGNYTLTSRTRFQSQPASGACVKTETITIRQGYTQHTAAPGKPLPPTYQYYIW